MSWFNKKLHETLEEADLKFINLEDQKYDPGDAVKAINIDDFQPDDELVIELISLTLELSAILYSLWNNSISLEIKNLILSRLDIDN